MELAQTKARPFNIHIIKKGTYKQYKSVYVYFYLISLNQMCKEWMNICLRERSENN